MRAAGLEFLRRTLDKTSQSHTAGLGKVGVGGNTGAYGLTAGKVGS